MSSPLKLSNNAIGRLAGNISAVDTSFSLQPGQGALFPVLGVGEFCNATLVRSSDGAMEIVKVTARSADDLTVTRAQETTSAITFLAGDRIELRLTAGTFTDEIARVDNTAASNQTAALAAAAAAFAAAGVADGKAVAAQSTADAALPKAGGTLTGDLNMAAGKKIVLDGATADAFKTSLDAVDPTANNALLLPNKSGTLATTGDITAVMQITERQEIQYGPTIGTVPTSDLIPQSQINNTLAVGVNLKCSVAPTLFSVANGNNADGSPNNLNWLAVADIPLTGLPASSTSYIYADTVAKTIGSVTVADTEQNGGTIPVTNNKYTFDTSGMKMYLGNGSAAAQVNRIIVAEVDTDATKVTAIRCRPYLGIARSVPASLPAAGTLTSFAHNSGTQPESVKLLLTCNTAEGGFVAGRIVEHTCCGYGSGYAPTTISRLRNLVSFSTGSGSGLSGLAINTASIINFTPANWTYQIITKRRAA